MVPAVRPLGPLSMARGCARIDSRPDTAKIGSADRVEVHHARLLAVIGVRKTFPHGLGQMRKRIFEPDNILVGIAMPLDFCHVPTILRDHSREPIWTQFSRATQM